MKKILLTGMFLFLVGTVMQSQVKIGDSSTPPAKGALLDLNGTYKGGLLLPKVPVTDLGKIPAGFTERGGADTATELEGMIVWSTDETNPGLYSWDGENWQPLTSKEALPCVNAATQATSITIPGGPFAYNETFTVSCEAVEDGSTFYVWTVPAGLSIIGGAGSNTISVKGPGMAGSYDKSGFSVIAVNYCGLSAARTAETGPIEIKSALSNTSPATTAVVALNGESATLNAGTVTGGNCGSYTYQWQKKVADVWTDIEAATNATYTTLNLTADTQYRRITLCGAESVISEIITVTIVYLSAPTAVTANKDNVCPGTEVQLSASGGTGSRFAWYSGSCGGTLVGTGTTLDVSPESTTEYWGRWENGTNTTECLDVTINVLTAPTMSITTPTTWYVGQTGTFTATVDADSYRWFVNDVEQPGTTKIITIENARKQTYSIRCDASRVLGCFEVSASASIKTQYTLDCDGCRRFLDDIGLSKTSYPAYSYANSNCYAWEYYATMSENGHRQYMMAYDCTSPTCNVTGGYGNTTSSGCTNSKLSISRR
jgi:hypothetical protein